VDQLLERQARLPGDATSPSLARRFVRSALHEAGLDDLADDALLLTSELCENAVLHAGTGFEVSLVCAADEVTITVADHGSTAMELRRIAPTDRVLTHNRGLQIVDAVASAWGSRHDAHGHQVWFTLRRTEADPIPAAPPGPREVSWPDVPTAKWLLHVPAPGAVTTLDVLVTELIRRLCDVLPAEGASVLVDYGQGERELARCGQLAGEPALTVELPLFARRAGRLRVWGTSELAIELAELIAQRVALAVESDWLRGVDRERRTWLTYLTEAGELLTHSLDVQLTTTMVPQIVVPRLGNWGAVHLLDTRHQLRLEALTHVDETELPRLRENLAERVPAILDRLLETGNDATGLPAPVDGVAVPLRVGERPLGTLSVGRPGERAHGPDEIMMLTELARRAAQAIDNAQRNAAHVATAQALQQALLPRALPSAAGVRFAATYQPVSFGAEVGGDFYDVVAISPGRWLAAIGDVCGKGPRAASRTSLVRDVLRVLVRQGTALSTAVGLLHEMMMEAKDPDQFATVAVALVTRLPNRPALGIELILAGHEQPALVRADGSVQLVGTHGSAVGLVPKFTTYPTNHILTPGDTLVFYTDGITERRYADEQFGQERIVHTLASAAGDPADQLITDLLRAAHDFSPEPHQDDIAIMAVQVPVH
jgi:serine phosphatase RsbU (regulator of sigma subunit)/anti-sigma regulatory factor (Ser/Thr protein kinase)